MTFQGTLKEGAEGDRLDDYQAWNTVSWIKSSYLTLEVKELPSNDPSKKAFCLSFNQEVPGLGILCSNGHERIEGYSVVTSFKSKRHTGNHLPKLSACSLPITLNELLWQMPKDFGLTTCFDHIDVSGTKVFISPKVDECQGKPFTIITPYGSERVTVNFEVVLHDLRMAPTSEQLDDWVDIESPEGAGAKVE